MTTLFLLDASAYLYRSYHAIAPMSNAQGEAIHALYGFARSLFKLQELFSPRHLAIIFDGPDSLRKRKELYPAYKAHRTKMAEDLYQQIDRAKELADLLALPKLALEGVEADDVIGSIAMWAKEQEWEVRILSSDKDLMQLVDGRISLLDPMKGYTLIDAKAVEAKFGVPPSQIADYLALCGDASDNIPGVKGIGPKSAVRLLKQFSSTEELLQNLDVLPNRERKLLCDNQESLILSKQLVQVDGAVPFPKEISFFEPGKVDQKLLNDFYQRMSFFSLLPKRGSVVTQESSHSLISTKEELIRLIRRLQGEKEVAFAIETALPKSPPLGIAFGIVPEECCYLPLTGTTISQEEIIGGLRELFQTATLSLYGHGVKDALHALTYYDLPLPKISFDTLLASYLLEPERGDHALDRLAKELDLVHLSFKERFGATQDKIEPATFLEERFASYVCDSVALTIRLKSYFSLNLEKLHLTSLFEEIELPLIKVLVAMERRGIPLDVHKLKAKEFSLRERLAFLQREIFALAGEEFNLNSTKQLSEVLFQRLSIPLQKRTKSGFSTSSDVLEQLRDVSPIIDLILRYRGLEKLRSTYVESLPKMVNPQTGRIHCTFSQSVTATGRLACQDPNLQNIPVRSDEGKEIRAAFALSDGKKFLAADYSQIELRILAHLSDDPALLEAFREGQDVHTKTASLIFHLPMEEVSSKLRERAKAVNFGVLYGQGAYGLSRNLNIPLEEAKKFIEAYFDRYRGVQAFVERQVAFARQEGYVMTLLGRRRPLPNIRSNNPQLRSVSERLAVNTPIQGSNADIIKKAMIAIDERLKKQRLRSGMVLQIHDELLFETEEEEIELLEAIVRETMEGVVSLKIPLIVDVKIGKNWAEC